MGKEITDKQITERLNSIFQAAAEITGNQHNHMIAMAIMNEAEGLAKAIAEDDKRNAKGAEEGKVK